MTEIKKINDRDGSRQDLEIGDCGASWHRLSRYPERHFTTNGSDEGLTGLFEGLDGWIMT